MQNEKWEKMGEKLRENRWGEERFYLGHFAHHIPTDHQSLNKGTCCHKCACDHHLHYTRCVSKGPQCLYLLGHTFQVVFTCNQSISSLKSCREVENWNTFKEYDLIEYQVIQNLFYFILCSFISSIYCMSAL